MVAHSHLIDSPSGSARIGAPDGADWHRTYPQATHRLRHQLVDEPMLQLDALKQTALRMNPDHVERRISNAANGADFAKYDNVGAIDEVIENIQTAQSWVMLRFLEQLPDYREFLHGLLAEIADVTGPIFDIKGFVFISSPDTLTPFHFDPEYNILFQLSGDKCFATHHPIDKWLTEDAMGSYCRSGDNLLPWKKGGESEATLHHLKPGDALFVPYTTPHWVRVGPDMPSVSLSVTWQDRWSVRSVEALHFNQMLKRRNLPVSALPNWPITPDKRAFAYRAMRKLRFV